MSKNHIFIRDLKNGMTVDQVFLVSSKDLRTTRNGGLYITLGLQDKTGNLPARMWQASETIYNSIQKEGYLHVKGRCEDYRGNLQFIVEACRPVPSDKVDLADYMPTTEKDIEKMWSELLEILRDVKNKHVRLLIKKFVEDREFVTSFKNSPAAMSMHHAFIGGLLEHTLNVARAAKALLPMYPELNGDLVLAGVFLHDIGKTAELTSGPSFGYTDRGQLVGHITMATIWVQEKAKALAEEIDEEFPQKTLDLLQHIILSHHGVHEYGSPKLPAIPESYFIHYLDNLDAKMYMTVRDIDADPDSESAFTSFSNQLQTRIYKNSAQLD